MLSGSDVPTDPRMYFGCFLVSSSTILSINYIAICILETGEYYHQCSSMFLSNEAKSPVLLALTLIRVYKHRSSRSTMGWARLADFLVDSVRFSKSSWVHQLYTQGKYVKNFFSFDFLKIPFLKDSYSTFTCLVRKPRRFILKVT